MAGRVDPANRRAPGDTAAKPNAGLWIATRTPDGWSESAFLGGVTRHGACDLVFVRDFSGFYRVALRTAIGTAQTP
jgi:hypothetical protein